MAWKPLSDRNLQLQARLRQCAEREMSQPSVDNLYNDKELGLLDDAELDTWLAQRLAAQSNQSPLPLPTLRDGDSYQAEPLGWLQDNALSPEDKAWATREYRRTLFRLWRMHVARTGETWYPPLLNDLRDRYRSISASDRSTF